MNTTLRSIVSSTIALGLVAFTVISAFAFGAAASPTLLGFGFLAAYGILEIAVASYEGPEFASARRHPESHPAIVEYPQPRDTEEIARAA